MTVLQNVSRPLMFAGNAKQIRYERASQALKIVGLGNCMQKRLYELSCGQRQQIAIARTLINDPGIILADELTGYFDKSGNEIMCALMKLSRQRRTIIIVTHEPSILKLAQHIGRYSPGMVSAIFWNRPAWYIHLTSTKGKVKNFVRN